MRLAALLACLAVVACSPTELGQAPDATPCSSACGAGTVCELGRCVPVDAGPSADTGVDVPLDHGGDDVPGPMDVVDVQQIVDVGEADAGVVDVGPGDSGVVDAGVCSGMTACTADNDCAACAPVADAGWCCSAIGRCRAAIMPGYCASYVRDGGGPINCGRTVLCANNDDCGRCTSPPGQRYCCNSGGECVLASGSTCS